MRSYQSELAITYAYIRCAGLSAACAMFGGAVSGVLFLVAGAGLDCNA